MSADSLRAEIRDSSFLSFARGAVVVCVILCCMGALALGAWIVGGYEVAVASADGTRAVGIDRFSGTFAAHRDVSPLVLGVATAAFAACMLVGGAALPQARRLPAPSLYVLGASFLASLLGLVLIALSLRGQAGA